MKALLPLLKTKLFLLGFVSACTIVLAATVPQIKNFIAPEKMLDEKITTEQKKIAPKIKKQNKTINASRVTSNIMFGMNNSFDATVQTDKPDYVPGEYVIITGSGWEPGEIVTLNIVSDCGCTNETYYALADGGGNIYNGDFLIMEWHLGALFYLTATGQNSGQIAQAIFTDASTVTPGSGGNLVPADRAANSPSPAGGAYTTLGTITVQEGSGGGNTGDFAGSGTLILTAPSGWKFNPSVGTIGFSTGNDITGSTITVSPTIITVTLTIPTTAKRDQFTITGIQVKADDGTNVPGMGNIYRSTSNPGTATINGVSTTSNTDGTGGTSFAPLAQTHGALYNFIIKTTGDVNIPDQIENVSFNIKITAKDQFGNTVTSYTAGGGGPGSTTATLSSNATITSSTNTGNFANGVIASFPVTISPAFNSAILTVTSVNFIKSGTSNSFNVITPSNPTATISSISPLAKCAGDADFTLTVNGSNFISSSQILFNGSPKTTTFVNAGQLTTTVTSAEIASSGNYNVAVQTPAPGGGTTSNLILTVNPLPAVYNVIFTGSLCGTATIKLSSSETGVNYQLYKGNSTEGSPVAGTGGELNFGAFTGNGLYTVVATNATTGCTRNMSGSVDIGNGTEPTLYNVTGGGSYCPADAGVPVGLDDTETGVNYQLYNGLSTVGSPVAGTGNPISFGNQTAAGTYTVVGTRTNGSGCSATMNGSANVVIKTLSTAPTSITTDADNFCSDAGGNITLTANGGSAGTGASVYWYTGGCGTGSPNVTAGNTLVVNKPTITTTYYARYQGDCNTTDCASITITVKTLSVAPTSAVSDVDNFCANAGGNIQLTASGGTLGTGAVVKWYTASCGGTLVGTGNPLTISKPTSTTTYYARYEGDCNVTTCASVLVTVKTLSMAPTLATVNVNNFCANAGGDIELTASGGSLGTGAVVKWYTASCGGTLVGTGNPLTISKPNVSTTYYARYEGDCNVTTCASVPVTVLILPDNISGGFTGNTICFGETGQLSFDARNDAGSPGPFTIEYKETSGSTIWTQVIATASETAFNVAVNPTITTGYTLVSITNANGCKATTGITDVTATITVRQLPTITLGSIAAICKGTTTATLPYSALTNGANQYSIDYSVGAEGEGFVDVTNAALAAAPNNISLVVPAGVTPGTYTGVLTVRNSSTGCVSNPSYNISITIDGVPVVTTVNTCIGNSNVTFTQSGGTLGGTWSVSGGGTINPATGEFNETTYGCYTATYTTPNAGCSDTKSFFVSPPPPPAPTVPNTCNTNLVANGATLSGLTTQYSFDDGPFSTVNTSPNATPGCHTVQVRFVVTNTCGSLLAGTPILCGLSPKRSAVIFPAAPAITTPANTCNSAFVLPTVDPVSGFDIEYSINGGAYAASPTIPTTAGCYTIKARYVLAEDCGATDAGEAGTGSCAESNEVSVVIFPVKPILASVSNTCNSKLADITAVTPVAGFTAEYAVKKPGGNYSSFGTLAATNALLDATPGCWSMKARYKLTGACGATSAGATSSGTCGESDEVYAVVFPAPPSLTAPANTCNAAFSLPTVAPVTGFGVEFNINFSGWSASPTIPSTPGCYMIYARYVLSNGCGSTSAGSDGPVPPCDDCPVIGGCTVSSPVNVVIFPAAPSAPVVTNTCNAALTIPTLSPVTGFTAQYSFDNGGNWSTSNVSASTTPGCFSMKTRYVANACGAIGANTPPPVACQASATGYAVIFPAKPSAPVVSNTCNAALTIPALTYVSGFSRQYSFDGTTWGTSNTSSTTPGCYTLKSRYILTAACGTIAANTEAPCGSSDASNAVIFPAAPTVAAINNTCNAKLANITDVAAVPGFTAEYAVKAPGGSYSSFGTLATANASLANTPGCWSVKARYKLTAACGTTNADATSSAGCGESAEVSAVVFPAAPLAPTVNGTCGPIIVTPPSSVPGFNIEYSFDDGVSWGANTPPTADNCTGYKIRTRYVTASTCGTNNAGTAAPEGCAMSPATTRKVDNTAPTGTNPTAITGVNSCLPTQVQADAAFSASLAAGGYSDNCTGAVTAEFVSAAISGTNCDWTITYTFKVKDVCENYTANQTYTRSGSDQTIPVITYCKSNAVKIFDFNETNYTVQGTEFDVSATDNCQLASMIYTLTGATTGGGTSSSTSLTGVDLYSGVTNVRWTATDGCGNTSTCGFTVTVGKRPTTLTYTGDFTEQYSDVQLLKATLIDQTSGNPLPGKTISFTLGSQSVSDGPGAPGNGTDNDGKAEANLQITQNIGKYNLGGSFEGDETYLASSFLYNTTSPDNRFSVTKEDAVVNYTGQQLITTAYTSIDVLLTASINDIADASRGNISTAKVKFVVETAVGSTLVTQSPWLNVNLADATLNTTDGYAAWTWVGAPVPGIAGEQDQYNVRVVVNCDNTGVGNYIGDDISTLDIMKTTNAEFITGGGYVIPTNSLGSYKADNGRKMNFGFNIKWNKSFKNLQGKLNVIYRVGSTIYQVKTNATSALTINSTNPCNKTAVFTAKANLTDVTNPLAPVSVLSGLNLTLKITDNGEPGNNDKWGLSLYDGNTLVLASQWGTGQLQELTLGGGNIVIHSGNDCNNSPRIDNSITSKNAVMESPQEILPFNVKAFPNPSGDEFNVYLENANNEPVSLILYDALGRQIKKFEKESGNIPIHFGRELKGGLYILEVRQGENRKTIKLIKQN